AAGAVAFLALSLVGETVGRLLGAALLGAVIGGALALVEAAFRHAWLEVRYGLKEVITISLGDTPVRIGSDGRACQVYARGAAPLAFQYRLEEGKVVCIDYATETSAVVEPSDEKTIGAVTVTVRASRQAAGAPAAKVVPPPPPRTLPAAIPAPPGTVAPSATAPGRVLTAPPPRTAVPPTTTHRPATASASPASSANSAAPSQPIAPPPPAPRAAGDQQAVRPIPPPPPPSEK
ncbi:MAG: hypothetical protein ACYC6M_16165, partial [Terriglobales bacterium]